jgi:hypothetical protein
MEVRRKLEIITIDTPTGAGTKFKFKIPEDFVLVDGYDIASVNDGVVANGVSVGLISISFNSKASTPIVGPVVTDKLALKETKYGFYPLLEPVKGGTYIEGYFISFLFPIPAGHKILIYLRGKQVILDKNEIEKQAIN